MINMPFPGWFIINDDSKKFSLLDFIYGLSISQWFYIVIKLLTSAEYHLMSLFNV